jgi:hypothetical protein
MFRAELKISNKSGALFLRISFINPSADCLLLADSVDIEYVTEY